MSEHNYSKVTHTSYSSRVKNSFAGIATGVVLFLGAFPLLFFNEGRAVKTYQALKEGASSVISISAQAPEQKNNGKLVHLTGMATTKEKLRDNDFGLSLNAIALKRTVEMYQWKENKRTRTEKTSGGGERKVTTYNYTRKWSSSLIKSSNFNRRRNHENPSRMPYNSKNIYANQVRVGEFALSKNLIKNINKFEKYNIPANAQFPRVLGERARVERQYVYYGANSLNPRVGDIRVKFETVSPQIVSAIAQQNNNDLIPYTASNGSEIEILHLGQHSAQKMFEGEQTANAILTWSLRFGGFFMMLFGISLLFKPLSVLADKIPLLGTIISFGTGIVALAIAGPLTLTTIAIAWITNRPVMAVSLIAVGALVAIITLMKKKPLAQKPTTHQSSVPDLPNASASNYYVYIDDKQYGPYSVDQIQEYLSEGRITLSTACSDVEGQHTMSISEIPGVRKSA